MDSNGCEEVNGRCVADFINEPLHIDGQTVETIDERIKCFERELIAAVSDIAHLVDRKYEKFVPEVIAENSLLNKLEEVLRTAEQSENEIRERIKAIDEDLKAYKGKDTLSRLSYLLECKEKIGVLEDIEENLVRLLHTPIEGDEDGPLMNARLIADIEQRIETLNKNESDIEGLVMDRIYPALLEQLETVKGSLAVYLSSFFEQLYEVDNDEDGNLRILKVMCEHPSKVSKHLSAMQTLRMLDAALAKLCTWIMRNMCSFIILSKNPNEVFSLGECMGAVVGKREYRIRTDLPTAEGVKKPHLDVMFQTLRKFFEYLAQDLEGVIVNETLLTQMVGKKMAGELVDIIVKECLTPAVPYSSEEKPQFESLLTTADNFHSYLTKLGFFTSETITFKRFADSYNTVFINRRCTTFIMNARSLIDAPLMPLLTVGSSEHELREAIEAFKKANSFVGNAVASGHCPSLMQLMQCKVSESCVKLFGLVEECLKEAANSDSDVAAGRLFQTALNMVQLFILIAPRQHEAQLSSVPLMTAVFYNNCHYICHCLMTASIDLHPQIVKAMKGASCGISFTESLPRLRKIAAELMESQLTQCRRQISTILADDQLFVGLNDAERLTVCDKTLEGCMMHLQQVSTVWKEVLTDTVYGNSMGDLSSFLLSTINHFVLKTVDIRAADAQIMVLKIQKILKRLEALFMFDSDNRNSIHRFAETAYYRTKEIVFCLDGSLQDVCDRWCNGKGPMAQWLNATEVRGLIKALFQNTAKRANVLATIK